MILASLPKPFSEAGNDGLIPTFQSPVDTLTNKQQANRSRWPIKTPNNSLSAMILSSLPKPFPEAGNGIIPEGHGIIPTLRFPLETNKPANTQTINKPTAAAGP